MVVCPVCLGEKPVGKTVALQHGGRTVYFCECPYCLEKFKEDPDTYVDRHAQQQPRS